MAYLSVIEVVNKYSLSRPTVLEMFKTSGSPAIKFGEGKGVWRVDEVKFEQFLLKRSEKFKG